MNHVHGNSIGSILIQGYVDKNTSPRFTTSPSSRDSITKAETDATWARLLSRTGGGILASVRVAPSFRPQHSETFTVLFLAGKRTEGRLEKLILRASDGLAAEIRVRREPLVPEMPFGITRLWNDCQRGRVCSLPPEQRVLKLKHIKPKSFCYPDQYRALKILNN